MPRTTAPAEIPLPITYTPTTHRISKAKKGKRVHACEFPGCDKVFTRAEHRRRHELNHNPEALYRCTQTGCKKSFHRSDLLTRHMERHELEAQMDTSARWECHTSARASPEQYIPRYTMITPAPYLAVTQPSIKAPALHPDLAVDGLMWNAMENPEQQIPVLPGPHVHEPMEDSRFYSTPEACPSPSSDGTTYSVPSYPGSSISSTSPGLVESYPDPVVDSELTSSPAPMHATIDWERAKPNVAPPSMASMQSFIHPALQSWSIPQQMSYNENFLPPVPYEASSAAKSWTL
ncbi:hypothetical protein BJX63DRAFT_293264 [Aspergillus granulosus]|uniref:C2H2-type domain-containing protein n=1 Tax=Aspergillus granulosus TaxID=176169 RepID=A0ABR4H729_9EURO